MICPEGRVWSASRSVLQNRTVFSPKARGSNGRCDADCIDRTRGQMIAGVDVCFDVRLGIWGESVGCFVEDVDTPTANQCPDIP